MRKFNKILVLALSATVAASAAALAACSGDGEHTHTYGSYQSDSTGHWQECTGCGESTAKESHVYDNDSDTDCNVCGYVREVEASGGATYKTPTTAYSVWQDYTYEQYYAEDTSTKEVAYQFVAEDVELSEGRYYDLLLNLYADGFVELTQYTVSSGRKTVYYGYWANMDNEYIYMGIVCHSNSTYSGTVYGISYSYNLTITNGTFDAFGLNLALGFAEGGVYVRNYDMSGTGDVTYSTAADFETHIGYEEAASDDNDDNEGGSSTATVLFSWTGTYCTLDCYTDGTYVFEYANMSISESGTWTWSSWTFTLTTKGGNAITATLDSSSYTLTLVYVADINSSLTDTFTCASSVWGSALGSTGSYTPVVAATVLFSWTGTYCTLDCYTDGTYVFEYANMSISESGTWTWSSWTFTLTTEDGNAITATLDSSSYTLTLVYVADINSSLTDTFTCESSVWGSALGSTGSYSAD